MRCHKSGKNKGARVSAALLANEPLAAAIDSRANSDCKT
jgi:hypothetical protein